MDTPEGTRIPPEHADLGPLETWQVWATGTRGKQGIVEVTAPRDMLPFAVVREAFRCRLQMEVTVEPVKGGGCRLSAKPLPPPPEVKAKLEEVKKEIEASGGTVEDAIKTIKEEVEKL